MDDKDIIKYSIIISACVSLISCLLLLCAIVLIKDFRSLPYKLISYLCLTDMLTSIAFLLPKDEESICILQAFIINFSILSSFLFTSVILHFLKWSIVDEKQPSRRLHGIYLLVAWVLPLALSSIPVFLDYYGKSTYWCWIKKKSSTSDYLLQIFEGYGFALVVLVYNVRCLVLVNRKLRKNSGVDPEQKRLSKKLMRRMVYYPLVIVICVFPAACLRIVLLGKDVHNIEWLEALAADFQCLIGFANCLVYGFTDNLKRQVKDKLKRLVDFEYTKMNQSV